MRRSLCLGRAKSKEVQNSLRQERDEIVPLSVALTQRWGQCWRTRANRSQNGLDPPPRTPYAPIN